MINAGNLHYSCLGSVVSQLETYLALDVVYGNTEVVVVLVMNHSSVEVCGQGLLDVIHQDKGQNSRDHLDDEHNGDYHTKL